MSGRTRLLLPLPVVAATAALTAAACGGGVETTTVVPANPPGEPKERPDPPADDAEPAKEAKPVLSPAAIRELERLADEAAGEVGIAVSPLGEGKPVRVGEARSGRAWSTMKVPLLVALIDRLGGMAKLSDAERDQAEAALTASDNDAAIALFDRLQALEGGLVPASRAIDDVLRSSGDSKTRVNTEPSPEGYTTFGQTLWTAEASTTFFRALAAGCLLPRDDTKYVLSLMERVVSDQRWGLGSAPAPDGATVAFKGGWGPEPDGGYLVRQGGIVAAGERGYVLSVIAIPDDTGSGSFPAGQELVTEAAAAVADRAGAGSRSAVTCGR